MATKVAIEPSSDTVWPRTSSPNSRRRRRRPRSTATAPRARRHLDAVSGVSGTGAVNDAQATSWRGRGAARRGQWLACSLMHAVTFQAPGEGRVDERPDPELHAPDDAIVRLEASGGGGRGPHHLPRPRA